MGGNQVAKPGIAGPDLDAREEDQQRDRRHDLRDHQRLVDEGIFHRQAAIGLGPGRRQRRHGSWQSWQ
jgi:hypothetical protein